MKYLLFLLLVCLIGCSYSSKMNRAGRKVEDIKRQYPDLFSTTTDTILIAYSDTITLDGITYDTTIYSTSDTIELDNDNLTTTIYVDRVNEVTKYRIINTIKSDTVIVERVKTKYITKESTTKEVRPSYTFRPHHIILLILIVLFIGWLFNKISNLKLY